MPWEIMTAYREDIRRRQFSPLMMRSWLEVKGPLWAEMNRRPEPVGPLAVQFRVPLARAIGRAVIDQAVLDGAEARH